MSYFIPESHKKYIIYTSNVMGKDIGNLMRQNLKFKKELISILRNCKFNAYYFQCDKLNFNKMFTFTLIDAPELVNIQCDYKTFDKQLKNTCKVCVFPNLSKNAILIAPNYKIGKNTGVDYRSVAHYFKTSRIPALMKLVEAIGDNIYEGCYLSTSGLGVHYLHVRIENTPKYYVDY